MPVNSGNFPKSMQGGSMKPTKKPQPMSKVMKQDRVADAKMTPAQMRVDIKADRKLLAAKVAKKGKKK